MVRGKSIWYLGLSPIPTTGGNQKALGWNPQTQKCWILVVTRQHPGKGQTTHHPVGFPLPLRWHHYTSPKHDTECSQHLGWWESSVFSLIDGRNPVLRNNGGGFLLGGRTRNPQKRGLKGKFRNGLFSQENFVFKALFLMDLHQIERVVRLTQVL